MSQLVIGLTGGIGSGKTRVSNLFAGKGIDIIDADVIARQVVEPGSPALQKITEHFGQAVLNTDGSLNRARLRERIFTHPEEKAWLNALLHPLIRQQMQQQAKSAQSPYCILAVPLLVENQLMALVDRVLVVDVDEQIQHQRVVQRDRVADEQVRSIMAAQASREARLAVADDIIDNSGPPEALDTQVETLHQAYLSLVNGLKG
ncbi:dephospho-CoA kinase [Bowmanella dokdonensis]|uniref:Dephospho-CoA kinase n=1 Tax=Bowmanella dokdonensis TaxID=751969 RepID=A0A939DKS0_9ALTE|nr:dephospho-CoA kinase [Bowmanella dokdonensis]MBN7824112.1 dephospho-CoA kinase [Bowmanella dokdonensis]